MQNFCIATEFRKFKGYFNSNQDAEFLHPNRIVADYVVLFYQIFIVDLPRAEFLHLAPFIHFRTVTVMLNEL